jgi:hypothetical protein
MEEPFRSELMTMLGVLFVAFCIWLFVAFYILALAE